MLARIVALSTLTAACSTAPRSESVPPETTSLSSKARVASLRARENAIRARFDPAKASPWIEVSGSDPYRIVADGDGFLGVLRGARALVALDSELRERQRVSLPIAPTALCRSEAGEVWVASRYDQPILRVRVAPEISVSEVARVTSGTADLACGSGGLVHVASADGELSTLDAEGRVHGRRPALAGDLRLLLRGRYLLENSLFERSLRVLLLDERGLPEREVGRVRHDGTLWACDAIERPGGLLVAVAGVEDRPLVRAHGEFENIDSFAWLYRLRGSSFEELSSFNLSELGVVVPKALGLVAGAAGVSLTALGAGSGRWLRATWPASLEDAPRVEVRPAPPGVADAVFDAGGDVSYVSPLLDAFVRLDGSGSQIVRVDPDRRPEPQLRLGEALFFTELMAPENVSSGGHSRFTCETCHFEGGVDGRVHYTGRADVSVVTKPLFGLANNRPHFSRAMDPDLSSVSHNEFRVAGAGSGTDPWFWLDSSRFPWLSDLGIARAELDPLELRAALLEFLYAFSHAPNPVTQGRAEYSALEAEGAHAFEQQCQRCHEARLFADDPSTLVPFTAWQARIFSRNAPIVWARGDYEKTGILPYVHQRGTRITSLRRLALKPRYFTNGSAPDLANVLARFRSGGATVHDSGDGTPLPPRTQAALLAFLRLL
jgi:hypothetical protein